jgi:hypothetical protein
MRAHDCEREDRATQAEHATMRGARGALRVLFEAFDQVRAHAAIGLLWSPLRCGLSLDDRDQS